MTTQKELLIQARDWIADQEEIVFASGGMAAIEKLNKLHSDLQAAINAPDEKPRGYVVETEHGDMFWPASDYDEACTYCDDGQVPEELFTHPETLGQRDHHD